MRNILFFVFLLTCLSSNAQTLFTYGKYNVEKKEFWRAFSKNNNGLKDEKAIREYLDLFIRFKLKVQAAKDAKLDTLPNIKNDIAGFRAQMIEQYIRNQGSANELVQEAFERSKYELEIAHVFIGFEKDSAKAKTQIEKAYQQLQSGANFNETVKQYTTNEYVRNTNGYIGFISAFSLPYEMENTVYNLTPGSVSKPVMGVNGYHIFKLLSNRKSEGTMKAAQILIVLPQNPTTEELNAAKERAQMVYEKLKTGEKFEDLVLSYSDDKLTFSMEGKLPDFTFTSHDAAFSKAAFALKKDGDFTEPVLTSNGYHIIKRISLTPHSNELTDPVATQQLEEKVSADPRMNVAIQKMKQEILKATGYKALPYDEKQLWTLTDTMLKSKSYASFFKLNQQKPLFLLKNKTISVADWLKYAKSLQTNANATQQMPYKTMMKEFVDQTAEQYYKDRLETMNEDFRFQLKEFSEGSLLFEIMERKVWSVAPLDSAGLIKYYNKNKSKYKWQPSVNAIIFNCSDTAIANQALSMMQKDPTKWKEYMDGFNGTALADSGRFELNQLPVTDQSKLKTGTCTSVVTNSNDGSASFCYIMKMYNTEDQRSFDEAKGLVINDYQLLLEETWINQLKKKYPVKVNEAVVKGMVK
jgi:peptidyl-prolyl cis-trans isomerase SurA